MPDDELESSKIRNDYIQFLKIQVNNGILHPPFSKPPPEREALSPLEECLCNIMADNVILNFKKLFKY